MLKMFLQLNHKVRTECFFGFGAYRAGKAANIVYDNSNFTNQTNNLRLRI